MNKKYLNYDESTGIITDANGLILTTYAGATPVEIKESTSIDDMIKLKNSGFTAEEVIQIKKANL
tara:strand:+ start:20708 stop:20902 length:195 start_codon:yes stop_codon:yes gene_type:complete